MIRVTFVPTSSARTWRLGAVLEALNKAISGTATVTMAFVSISVIRKWNKRYRGNDSPTDVLSFGWDTSEGLVGDVLLCKSVLAQEVGRSACTLEQLIQHRFVHGVLHILGHDHERKGQARRMEDLERQVLGFDPYQQKV